MLHKNENEILYFTANYWSVFQNLQTF